MLGACMLQASTCCPPAIPCCVHDSLCFEISGLPDKLTAWEEKGWHKLYGFSGEGMRKDCAVSCTAPPLRGVRFKLSLISSKI